MAENNNNQDASSSRDVSIASLNRDLQQVEHGLEGRGGRSSVTSGRAAFESVRASLTGIRSRLSLLQRGQDGNLDNVSRRLSRAELAHSEHIPLELIGNVDADEFRRRQHETRRASLLSQSALNKSAAAAASLEEDKPPVEQRRSSMLVASRVLAESVGALDSTEVVADFHDSTSNLVLSPVAEEKSESFRKEADTSLPERAVLLTKRQSLFISSNNLSGSLHVPPAAAGSTVYSWGPGMLTLHNDDTDVDDAEHSLLSTESRIGRPGAPAVISVATSQTHTLCATARGEVLACGQNQDGSVDPFQRDSSLIIKRPTLLESLVSQTKVLQVSAGTNHSAALSANGSVLTWGCNMEGQLGHRLGAGTKTFCSPQGMVLGGGGRRAAAVACGDEFTMVLTTRMSVVVCGVPKITGHYPTDGGGGTPCLAAPIACLEGLPLAAIAAGHGHAVVVTSHGACFAWGDNEHGSCGRPYPKSVSMPVPIHTPDTECKLPPYAETTTPFHNWADWDATGTVSLADDVAVAHACCGTDSTVLVTKSGRLLVCGQNNQGQLGLKEKSAPVTALVAVNHPVTGRRFTIAEAGDGHTLLLDDVGDVWEMGNDNIGLKLVLASKHIQAIAAGGKASIVVAAGSGSLSRQFSISSFNGGFLADDDILELVSKEPMSHDISSVGHELVSQTEELLMHPAVLNSLFMDPAELAHMYEMLISVGNQELQQAIAGAVQKGIQTGLERLKHDGARMIYPEAVRCLLLYIQFFDRDDDDDSEIVFDRFGDSISALCETILALPFEGYKAFVAWAGLIYTKETYVKMLVRPLIAQLEKALKVVVDDNGVEHPQLSRRTVPVIVEVLKWLYRTSERAGNLASPEDFCSHAVNALPLEALYNDLYQWKKSSKTRQSSKFFLRAYPFLLSPETKRNLLKVESEVEMMKVIMGDAQFDDEHQQYEVDPFFVLEIEREHILEQAMEKIKKTEPAQLRKKLRVVFTGEEGVDAGGVAKEFFQLLSEELFDSNSGMWSSRFGDQVTWFNSDCTWDDEGYELVGVLVGLALYNGVLLDVHFPKAVYRKLLGLPLGIEDSVDEEVKRGLQQLLDYEGDDVEFVFCLSFEVTWMALGKEQKVELKPGGSDIPVTSENREEYVLLYVKWLLVDSIQPQWDAFEKGLLRVMEGSSLDLFRPEELELLVVGTPDLDFDALEENTEYEGGYTKDSEVIRNFWRFIKQAPRDTQIDFLKFSTGSTRAPIGGLGALNFKIQRAGPDSPQLPTSHTCFNILLIPDYGADYDKLATRLGRAIVECEGFGLE